MAGNRINTKTKGKDDKNKTTKNIAQPNEDNEDTMDFSLLRKPILTSVTGFAQARKIFDLATEELKDLLSNECDLLYECKVCRNIFRSLANFISHKRVYCTERFNSSLHGQFFKAASTVNEMLKIKKLEESYLRALKNQNGTELVSFDEIDDGRIPLTKDLTTIIEKMVRNKGEKDCKYNEQNMTLQKIPNSNVAVFQSINTEEKQDKIKAQVKELDVLLSKDKAFLQNDGKFSIINSIPSETDSVIQISDDEDDSNSDNLKCKICEQNFSTQKTLKFHMKYKHLESRLVYPCPDCLEIFSTSWSVYRHLFKVHRKTAAQIRRLRESIQAKAFKMNNPPAFYEKRKNMKPPTQKISEEERLDQENQAWMDNVEGDGEVPRCFGCGRAFERRAALAAHTHTCGARARLAAARRPPDARHRIEIQIRKDYNKGPAPAPLPLPPRTDQTENKSTDDATITPILKETQEKDSEKQLSSDDILEEATMDIIQDDVKSNETDSPEKSVETTPQIPHKPTNKLPFAQQTEKSNLTAFRQKIQPDIEVNTLLCKKCNIRHNTVQELYDHMANHYKWMRYACKLCNFKTYSFEKLPEHVRVVHKLKGDSEFYFSTVKAISGNEALELAEGTEESNEANDESPDSRRQSRCSSDSSRLSDDSSSSSTRIDGSRKRKMCHIKNSGKRKKESLINDEDEDQKADFSLDKDSTSVDNDTSSISKTFEENSSDLDDIDERISKRHSIETTSSVASRRPVRKKTKPKNEDFEYDLSNLLKMEAQGYRDAQSSVNTKTNQTKKKSNQQDSQNYYEIINRDCCGALATLSKKAVENSMAFLKNVNFVSAPTKESRPPNVFARPMLPKTISRGEKNSPKKDPVDDSKDIQSPQKEDNTPKNDTEEVAKNVENENKTSQEAKESPNKDCSKVVAQDAVKTNLSNIPAVVPIKFRRQSLEFIKNPLINKNMTDFKKAGMKTKILVIKPINRSKDGLASKNTPLKFQTIKLKDPSKSSSSNEDKIPDQVVVVKVPKVDAIRTVPDNNALSTEKTKSVVNSINSVNNNVSDEKINKTPVESDSVQCQEMLNSDTSVNTPAPVESKSVSADKELKTDSDITENGSGDP